MEHQEFIFILTQVGARFLVALLTLLLIAMFLSGAFGNQDWDTE